MSASPRHDDRTGQPEADRTHRAWSRWGDRAIVAFALIVLSAVASMTLASQSNAAFAVQERGTADGGSAATPLPAAADPVDAACAGQAWGQETPPCLAAIARSGGRAPRSVRAIALAVEGAATIPNDF